MTKCGSETLGQVAGWDLPRGGVRWIFWQHEAKYPYSTGTGDQKRTGV
jgi:hypothetical protein